MQDLNKFENEMNLSGKNVYVGHRYVPKIFGEWDNTQIYEPLSIVQYQGASYTSRQYVPVGVELTNVEYWAVTGNYNTQVEQYRQDVNNVKTSFNEHKQAIDTEITKHKQEIDTELTEHKEDITNELKQLVVNAKDFGLVDGVTDSQKTQLQNAIDYAALHDVREVRIPKGTYYIDVSHADRQSTKVENSGIIVPSNIKITGSEGTTLIALGNNNRAYTIFNLNGVENVVIENINLIGDRYTHYDDVPENVWKMWQPNTEYLTGERVYTVDKRGYKVTISGVSGTTKPTFSGVGTNGTLSMEYINSSVGEWGFGVCIRDSKHVSLNNLTVKDFWGDGTVITGECEFISYDMVHSSNNRRQGLSIVPEGNSKFYSFKNCSFNHSNGTFPQTGVDIEPSLENANLSYVKFENCQFEGNNSNAIKVDIRRNSSLHYLTLTGIETLETVPTHAVFMSMDENSEITNISIDQSLIDGVNITGNLTQFIKHLKIENVDITTELRLTYINDVFLNNLVITNYLHTNNTITNYVIQNVETPALRLNSTKYGNIRNSSIGSINIGTGEQIEISNNHFKDATTTSIITLSDLVSDVIVTHNNVEGDIDTNKRFLNTDGNSSRLTVNHNKIMNLSEAGVYLRSGDKLAYITNNYIENVKNALYLSGEANQVIFKYNNINSGLAGDGSIVNNSLDTNIISENYFDGVIQ